MTGATQRTERVVALRSCSAMRRSQEARHENTERNLGLEAFAGVFALVALSCVCGRRDVELMMMAVKP